MVKFAAALSLVLANSAMGSQDSSYYPGFSNPNAAADPMYYKEAANVAQGIEEGEFDALYVQYHGCVWSEYDNSQGDDGYDAGCGAQEGEDAAWYAGNTQCFRANVAYTLYGVKSGDSVGDNPCESSNYINSFFTTKGIEAFGDSVGVNYNQYGASSYCNSVYNGAYYGYEGNAQNGEDNQPSYTHGQLMFKDYSSSSLGCNANGQFTLATFKGAHCDGNHFLGNTNDKYNYLNRALNNLGCVQVYNKYANQQEEEAENEGEQQEGQEQNNEEQQEADDMASYLLQRSATCSHTEYPGSCPDPFNVKKSRDENLHKYAQSKSRAVPAIMPIMTSLFCLGALVFFCLANGIRDGAKRRALEKAADARERSIYETFSQSFHRATTDLSTRTRTFTEKLAAYAEEEDEEEQAYEAPAAEEKAQTEVADAVLADKGVTPKKQYKRPRLARFSKWVRSKFGGKKPSK